MTFVGKVLVVVQVVLSVCFMLFAGAVYSVQNSWKEKHDKLTASSQSQIAELNKRLEETQNAKDEALKAETAATGRADTLQARVDGLTQENTNLANDLKEERDANIKEQSVATRYESEADIRKKEASDQRIRNESLLDSRGQLVARVQQLEDEKFNRDEEMNRIIEKYNGLLEDNTTLATIISANGLSTNPEDYLDKQAPPPDVEGLVLSTRRGKRSGTEFIEVSLGSDDGLLEGHDVHVFRTEDGAKYLGRINIVYVAPDRAVGTLVKRARNGSIQRGDNVKTKL